MYRYTNLLMRATFLLPKCIVILTFLWELPFCYRNFVITFLWELPFCSEMYRYTNLLMRATFLLPKCIVILTFYIFLQSELLCVYIEPVKCTLSILKQLPNVFQKAPFHETTPFINSGYPPKLYTQNNNDWMFPFLGPNLWQNNQTIYTPQG